MTGSARQSRGCVEVRLDCFVALLLAIAGTAPPRMHACCSVAISPTGRGSGIPFDRQNLVDAGAVAGTVEPPRRRPIAGGKSGKRRAYTLAAPEGSQGVRSELKPGIGRYKKTQKQRRVLTFESPFRNWRAAKIYCHSRSAVPANRERPSRGFVLSVPEKGPPAQATIRAARCFEAKRPASALRAAAALSSIGLAYSVALPRPILMVQARAWRQSRLVSDSRRWCRKQDSNL